MFFDNAGVKLYYEKSGSGAPLLLLHGWGGRADSFLPVTRDFSAGAHRLRRRFSRPRQQPGAARALVGDGIYGTDLGVHPPNGYNRVRHHRPLLRRPRGAPARRRASRSRAPHGAHRLRGHQAPRLRGKKTLRTRAYKALRALADNGLTRRLMGKRVDVWREKLVQKFGSADYKALSATMRPTFNRVIAQDLRGVLPRIKASTLLIWGTEDRDTPLWMGEVMAKEIPDAALVRLEGCGHFAYLEKYADFRAIAWKFLIG